VRHTNCPAKPSRQESEKFVGAGTGGKKITMCDRVQILLPTAHPLPSPCGFPPRAIRHKIESYQCSGHNIIIIIIIIIIRTKNEH
jgi:hypothetical protein